MLFTEPAFLFLFLPLVLGVYFAAPTRWRNGVLLVASLYFYAAGEGAGAVVMLASIAANYACGLAVAAAGTERSRRLTLAGAVVLNLGMLGVFKYAAFLVATANAGLRAAGIPALAVPRVDLPIGISFFTFQALSYVVDVYRGAVPAQRHLGRLALYVALFPQLIAGPIVRYATVAQQLRFRRISARSFLEGCRRFVLGLGKKMLLANGVARAADAAFGLPLDQLTAVVAWLGIVCYALQIYFDFSGYSDMAVGLGLMFGFRFPENFRQPYAAQSLTEFWRRWHITLSTWFRDYLYIPLGGNRAAPERVLVNLLVVFLLCGLWHGASWVFVVWGLVHGAVLVAERMGLADWLARRGRPTRHAYVLGVVLVAWVFFRSATVENGVLYLLAMLGQLGGVGGAHDLAPHIDARLALAMGAAVAACVPATPVMLRRAVAAVADSMSGRAGRTGRVPWLAEALALAVVFVASVILVAADTHNPFIYFRF